MARKSGFLPSSTQPSSELIQRTDPDITSPDNILHVIREKVNKMHEKVAIQ